MNNDNTRLIFIAVLVIPLALWLIHVSIEKEKRELRPHIEAWAAVRGLQLLEATQHWVPYPWVGGPFLLTSRRQRIYYILVADQQGKQRAGWLRIGSWWRLDFDKIEVVWDDT